MSFVLYKFRSQKQPSRIVFDGTGISVFDLKRAIIQDSNLGDGSDFNLAICEESSNQEYVDDTTIVPRSSSVIARRLPPFKPGKGTAARYISGRMPTHARVSRLEHSNHKATVEPLRINQIRVVQESVSRPFTNGIEDEQEKINAMFAASSEQWLAAQEKMAAGTRIPSSFNRKPHPADIPDHPPPPAYVCYRCGDKGHWIWTCPTMNDPNFNGKARVKRTTGIPRSFLKTVEKPDVDDTNGSIMVDANGDYVIAQPDSASWEIYKAKTQSAKTNDVYAGPIPKEHPEFECRLCHKIIKSPRVTPCCSKAYCEECIEQALLDSDFICPSCGQDDVLLDQLKFGDELKTKIQAYCMALS